MREHRRRRGLMCRRALQTIAWFLIAGATLYRIINWISHYGSLSSDMLVNSADDNTITFPDVTFCNLNPAKGTALIQGHANGTQLYEEVIDLLYGRFNPNLFGSNVPFLPLLESRRHHLSDMIKTCRMGSHLCDAQDFSYQLLHTGVCYTLHVKPDTTNVFLVVDPQGYDYLIPNNGIIGIRLMFHEPRYSLWPILQDAIYIGTKFQTLIRLTGVRQKFTHHCQSVKQMKYCYVQCVEDYVYKDCKCYLFKNDSCTLQQLAKCGFYMEKLTNMLSSKACRCAPPCSGSRYSVASITQALKSPLYARLLSLQENGFSSRLTVDTGPSEQELRDSLLLQQWAFLREGNRTAFDQLKNLARDLRHLRSTVNNIRIHIGSIERELGDVLTKLSSNCVDPIHSVTSSLQRIKKLGDGLVRKLRRSFLFRNLTQVPNRDLHIQLVHLFFLGVEGRLKRLRQTVHFDKLLATVAKFEVELFSGSRVKECIEKTSLDFRSPSHNSLPGTSSHSFTDHIKALKELLSFSKNNFGEFADAFVEMTLLNSRTRAAFPNSRTRATRVPLSSLVTLNLQMSRDTGQQLKLKSVQHIFNPIGEIVTLVLGGLALGAVLTLLIEVCTKACFRRTDSNSNVKNSFSTHTNKDTTISDLQSYTVRFEGHCHDETERLRLAVSRNFHGEQEEETRSWETKELGTPAGDTDSPLTSFRVL